MKAPHATKALDHQRHGTITKLDPAGSVVIDIDGTLHTVHASVVAGAVLRVGDHVTVSKRHHAIESITATDRRPTMPTRTAQHTAVITAVLPFGPASARDTQTDDRVSIPRSSWQERFDLSVGDVVAYEVSTTWQGIRTASRITKLNTEG